MNILTTQQVATMLNISDRQVRRLAQNGILKACKTANRNKEWSFLAEDVEAYLNRPLDLDVKMKRLDPIKIAETKRKVRELNEKKG